MLNQGTDGGILQLRVLRSQSRLKRTKRSPGPEDPGSRFPDSKLQAVSSLLLSRSPEMHSGMEFTGPGLSLPCLSSSPVKHEPRCGFRITFHGTLVHGHRPTPSTPRDNRAAAIEVKSVTKGSSGHGESRLSWWVLVRHHATKWLPDQVTLSWGVGLKVVVSPRRVGPPLCFMFS